MTDYLALRTEENEDALLKLERRLAAALAGAAGRTQGDREPSAAERDGQTAGAERDGQIAGAEAGIRSLLPDRERGAAEEGRDGPLLSPAGGGSRENRWEGLPLLPVADMAVLAAGGTPSPWRDALEAAEGRCALLEQLERLERAVVPPAAEGMGRASARGRNTWEQGAGNRLSGPLSPLSPPDGGTELAGLPEAAGGTALRSGPGARAQLPGGAADWAEQVDLAFRRDSRRYDGGFYLY